LRVGGLGQVGEVLAQFGDHRRAVQAEKRIDLLFQGQGRYQCVRRVLVRDLLQQRLRSPVIRFASQGKGEIMANIVMARVDTGIVIQLGQLTDEGVLEFHRMTAAVAIAGAGIKQCVPTDQGRLIGL